MINPGDLRAPFNALTRSIINLDKRLRKFESAPSHAAPMHFIAPLSAGWTQTPGHLAVGYYKDRSGTVFLQGTASGPATLPSVIFTLPENYRPGSQAVYIRPIDAIVDVFPDGRVSVRSGTNPVSFDAVSFRAAQ